MSLLEAARAHGNGLVDAARWGMTEVVDLPQFLHTRSIGELAVKMLHDTPGYCFVAIIIVRGIRHSFLLESIAV